jgi:nitroimidazol reductase NimA-like FMN-containing flavoprotein (pyridoxamine 5'-phosphate oxidase superfamily)
MNTTPGPGARLVELPSFDCWHLLESAEICRVAWNGPHGVAVVPVNYTVADGALWFRTIPYSQLARECGGQWVAVEVDSVDHATRSGWSAVIRGTAEVVDADDAPEHLAEFQVWPSGTRYLFIKVEPAELTGRKLLPPPADA